MRTTPITIAVLVTAALIAPARTEAKLPPCPGGRYLVAGTPLASALDEPSPDIVGIAGRMVSVLSGCDPVKARVRATARGTKVRARWKSCPGLTGKAVLNGTIMEQCRTLAATFTAKSAGIVKPFLASLSLCGDGVWDADGGEECDAGLGPCGDLCTACSCAGVTTTTTATATTAPSSTTAPGGTSTSTSTTTAPAASTTSTTSGPATTSSTGTVPTTTSTTGVIPTTTSTTTVVPTTTSTSAPVPTTTSTSAPVPTTTSTTSVGPTSSTSTMPALPTTSTTSTTLAGPDLAGSGWMSPGSAPSGAKIAVEFSVRNYGTATAVGPWYDYILLSTDYAIGNDTAIAVVQRVANLPINTQYTVLVPQVQLPALSAGTYYLFLHTDGTNAVAETQELNNLGGLVQLIVTP